MLSIAVSSDERVAIWRLAKAQDLQCNRSTPPGSILSLRVAPRLSRRPGCVRVGSWAGFEAVGGPGLSFRRWLGSATLPGSRVGPSYALSLHIHGAAEMNEFEVVRALFEAVGKRGVLVEPPCSRLAISDFERRTGLVFPADYREVCERLANGFHLDTLCPTLLPFGKLPAGYFQSLDEAVVQAKKQPTLRDNFVWLDWEGEGSAEVNNRVLDGLWPVADEGCGQTWYLELGGAGTGQMWFSTAEDIVLFEEGRYLTWIRTWLSEARTH